jgi:hypothetical protein
VARGYDCYPGGSHDFESDRVFAREAPTVYPGLLTIIRDNRDFPRRVVLDVCALGIDQFLDLLRGDPDRGRRARGGAVGEPVGSGGVCRS